MQLFAQFDGVSRVLLQDFVRKVVLFAVFAAFVSVLQTHGLAMTGMVLRTECLFAGSLSIFLATLRRDPFNAATLTYWDEALALAGIGLLSRLTTSLASPEI